MMQCVISKLGTKPLSSIWYKVRQQQDYFKSIPAYKHDKHFQSAVETHMYDEMQQLTPSEVEACVSTPLRISHRTSFVRILCVNVSTTETYCVYLSLSYPYLISISIFL